MTEMSEVSIDQRRVHLKWNLLRCEKSLFLLLTILVFLIWMYLLNDFYHCCSDENLKGLSSASAFDIIYRRNKKVKELLSPFLYSCSKLIKINDIISFNNYNICKMQFYLQLLVKNNYQPPKIIKKY